MNNKNYIKVYYFIYLMKDINDYKDNLWNSQSFNKTY